MIVVVAVVLGEMTGSEIPIHDTRSQLTVTVVVVTKKIE